MDDFDKNKHFQFGTTNPTLMEKPFWKYMVCNPHLKSYDVYKNLPGRYHLDSPVWCYARFGATQTYLPDGRLIQIGGEHEDSYDPDFQIYNDVVVINNPILVECIYNMPVPSNFPQVGGRDVILGTSNVNDVTIYAYPFDVFPPTDNHTATYVRTKNNEECIYIIGGYHMVDNPEKYSFTRHNGGPSNSDGTIRVYRLCLSDFSIERVKTSGMSPTGCTRNGLHYVKSLNVEDRQIIELSIHSASLRGAPQIYRLDVETGVWSFCNI